MTMEADCLNWDVTRPMGVTRTACGYHNGCRVKMQVQFSSHWAQFVPVCHAQYACNRLCRKGCKLRMPFPQNEGGKILFRFTSQKKCLHAQVPNPCRTNPPAKPWMCSRPSRRFNLPRIKPCCTTSQEPCAPSRSKTSRKPCLCVWQTVYIAFRHALEPIAEVFNVSHLCWTNRTNPPKKPERFRFRL